MKCGCVNNGVGGHLCHHQVETLGLVAAEDRVTYDGSQFDNLFPAANLKDVIVNPNGNVKYTVEQMEQVVRDYHWQSRKIAKHVEGRSIPETLENAWNFYTKYLKYKLDKDGVEELRTPARAWHDGQIMWRNPATRDQAGIDCDCFSISISCILTVLKIKHKLRVTKYSGGWQHVYVTVPVPGKHGYNWIVDCVLDKFNIEKPYSDKFDYTMNGLGIPVAVLSGLGDAEELHGITSGNDFDIQGFGGDDDLGDPESELGALHRHLKRTRDFIRRNPEMVAFQPGGLGNTIEQLDFVLNHWNTPHRMAALTRAAKAEHTINVRHGLSGEHEFNEFDGIDDPESVSGLDEALSGLDGEDDYHDVDVLGRAKKSGSGGKVQPKKFMQNARKAAGAIAKKAAQKGKEVAKKAAVVAKKAIKATVRYNPLTAAARGGYLLILKENWWGMAHKLYPAFLTLEEARSKGYSQSDWEKAQKVRAKVIKIFVNTLQGKQENLVKVLSQGYKRQPKVGFLQGLGTDDTLGVAASAAASAGAAAAPTVETGAAMTEAGIVTAGGGSFLTAIKKFFSAHKEKILKAGKSDAAKGFAKSLIDKYKQRRAAKKALKKNSDGSVTNDDGSTTYPDGSIKEADGTTHYEDGTSKDASGNDVTEKAPENNTEDQSIEKVADKMSKVADVAKQMESDGGGDGSDDKSEDGKTDGANADKGTTDDGKNGRNPAPQKDETPSSDGGIIQKIKDNPGKTVLIGSALTAATLMIIPKTRNAIIGAFTGKKNHGLSGVGKKRRKKAAKKRRVVSPNTPYSKRKVRFVKM